MKCEGLIKPEKMHEWLQRLKRRSQGRWSRESRHCYKRLEEILTAQGKTIRVLHTLTPVGVAMAGADEFDPYKD